MSIKAKRVKSSEARTKGRKGTVQRAGMVESTTEVMRTLFKGRKESQQLNGYKSPQAFSFNMLD